jgi:hypothetical protein
MGLQKSGFGKKRSEAKQTMYMAEKGQTAGGEIIHKKNLFVKGNKCLS